MGRQIIMNSILITGGAGFIGSNIAETLLSEGYRVIVLDDLSTGKTYNLEGFSENKNFTFYQGSILDRELLKRIMREHEVTHISHQAARPSVAKSIQDPILTTETNITGTVTLFHTAAELGCKRIVFASSSSVYGDTPELPKREEMPFNPKSPYAVSKAAKEMFARTFTTLTPLEIVGLRYFNVYGRRQDPNSDYAAVIPKFIAKSLRNEPIPIEGDGLQTRDFTYIDDVIKANIKALTAEGVSGMVFNIAYGSRISVLDLAREIIKITSSRSVITHGQQRPGDVRDSLASIERAKKYLGHQPEFNISKGLDKTVEWYRNALVPVAQ
jgi:UDP-glucose 4-epimerase